MLINGFLKVNKNETELSRQYYEQTAAFSQVFLGMQVAVDPCRHPSNSMLHPTQNI